MLTKQYIIRNGPLMLLVPAICVYIGSLLDAHENNRMTKFRDKSALYGREMKPGEPPSWP